MCLLDDGYLVILVSYTQNDTHVQAFQFQPTTSVTTVNQEWEWVQVGKAFAAGVSEQAMIVKCSGRSVAIQHAPSHEISVWELVEEEQP